MDVNKEKIRSNNLVKGKKLLKVKVYELTNVVKELRYGLILNGKLLTDLKNEILIQEKYTLEEILKILIEYPCEL